MPRIGAAPQSPARRRSVGNPLGHMVRW